MHPQLQYPFDPELILSKRKRIKRELLEEGDAWLDKRVAILGGSTTHDIRDVLELFLLGHGIRAEFHESEYAQYWQDGMFPNAELEAFQPDTLFIHTSNRNVTQYPNIANSTEGVDELLNAEYNRFTRLWDRLSAVYHCPIVQNNFEYPYYRPLGNKDAADVHGRVNFITRLNLKFAEYAQTHGGFYLNDINWQSADYGLERWSDPFYWHMYKYALALPAIPTLAHNVANIIKSIFGKNKKAFALDLDNTLWGGVVGDDGAENIAIGQETSMGQVYAEFQDYVKQHKQLGVILNIVSKNDPENALAGLNRPDCTLHPDDFIAIKANWEPKSENIVAIAHELSLGADSFVFVDDNPAEREIVRQQVSGVAIPELIKPEHYIYAIDRAGYFEVTALSNDDLNRNEMYKTNAERSQAQLAFTDYNDYLLSLEMIAEILPFAPMYMSRIAQLTNKSNQFNLTTQRFTQEEIERATADPRNITLYGKLIDKFGDNGVVSVVSGEIEGAACHIRLWLMSCRVLKRDMEFAMMDELVSLCRQRGVATVCGYYYPTAKNAMVRDFYDKQGFTRVDEDESGNKTYKLHIAGYERKCRVINTNGGGL